MEVIGCGKRCVGLGCVFCGVVVWVVLDSSYVYHDMYHE